MKRKLVKQGTSTLMVSLPSKWIKENKLDKGSEIDIAEKENSLLITLEEKKIKKSTKINISLLSESSIRTIITNLYRLGYDRITIEYMDKKVLEIIKDVLTNNLIGFEINKKDDKSCLIENITEPSQEQFDNIFSKVLMNIEELIEISKQRIEGEDIEYEDTESKILQFDNFCRRVISNQGNYDKIQLRWAFHTELIHAQREIYHMLKYLSNKKIKEKKEILETIENVKKMFFLLRESYEKKDIKLIERMHILEKEFVYKKGYSNLEKDNSIIIHHLLNATRSFYLASSPLIGIIT